MSKTKYTYIVHSRAWYADRAPMERDATEEVHVRCEGEGGWEFSIRLYTLTPDRAAFRIEMFDDTWRAFTDIPNLFQALAELGDDTDMGELEAALTEHGFTDATPTTNPGGLPDAPLHHCSRCSLVEPVRS